MHFQTKAIRTNPEAREATLTSIWRVPVLLLEWGASAVTPVSRTMVDCGKIPRAQVKMGTKS